MKNYLKSYLAGIFIGLGALEYMVCSGYNNAFQYTLIGAFLFATGLLAVCAEGMILVTGQFSKLYDGSWTFRQILLIFVANLIGIATIYGVRMVDVNPQIVQEVGASIAAKRDALVWYQHIFKGILCGICIEMACANYRNDKSSWCVILPVMTFIIVGGEHCVADTMYYLFAPGFAWRHVLQIFEVFCGNLIGAVLVVFASQNREFHFVL